MRARILMENSTGPSSKNELPAPVAGFLEKFIQPLSKKLPYLLIFGIGAIGLVVLSSLAAMQSGALNVGLILFALLLIAAMTVIAIGDRRKSGLIAFASVLIAVTAV